MQRLHDKDVTGVLLADGGWTHLCLPAEAVSSVDVVFPFSKRTVHRNPAGENRLLDPLRLSDDVLKAKKTELGSVGYAGQYMQENQPRLKAQSSIQHGGTGMMTPHRLMRWL